MSNASNLSTLANVLDDGSSGQFLKSTGSGGVAFDTVAAGAVVYATADLLPLSGFAAGDMAYVTATNRFYINNGSGWYSVSLVNTNPNITSVQDAGSNTTPFTLATDGTATVITVTAADPEEVPLTYGYSVTTGAASLNGSTVTQGTGNNTNVFTVTPHASQDATFTLTFTASDGINQATSANAFSLSFVTVVTDSNHTTLLATATGTSDNNNITDSSSNSHSITVNGDSYAGTFSPYRSGGYSTYFDGTTNTYLNVSSSSGGAAIGSGDFTISFWVYFTGSLGDGYLLDYRPLSNATGNHLVIYTQADGTFRYKIAGTDVIVGNTAISTKQWAYFCVARDNGTTKMYVNGTLQTDTHSGTENLTNGSNRPVIGTGAYSIQPFFNGYISDLRVVTSLDTTAYSVPTERVSAVTNTSLLTCHLPYISDGSTNAHTITVNGNVFTKPFSPYDYNEYDAADHGGSVYFDGTDDRLETSAGKIPSGSTNFTVSCWFYSTRSSTDEIGAVFGQGAGSGGRVGIFLYGGTNTPIKYSVDSGDTDTGVFALRNVWYFVELQVTSSTAKMFINGVEESSKSLSGYSAPNTDLTIGNLGSSWSNNLDWTGYISDFLVQTGTPSGSSTVPTSSRSSSGAELHIKGTDASIIDKSQSSNLKLVGNTTGSTTQVKFANTKSMYFDGTGDYIDIPADDSIFSKDYTIEFWMYPAQDTNLLMPFSKGVGLQFYHQSGNIAAALSWNNSSYSYNGNFGSITTNAWSHISLVRDSSANTYKFYINGTLEDTVNSSSNISAGSENWIIGGYRGASYNFEGYIQDLRITKDLARYTANFTPPAAPLEG
jgi:hypothetical protein